MVPRAMTTIVQEGIEPMLIGTHLLQRIQYKPAMTTVFPALQPCRQRKPGTAFSADLQQQHWGCSVVRCSRDASRTATEDSHVICG